jgi:lysozyme family protein
MSAVPDLVPLLQREGGFVDHPADRGGPTKYGITEQRARAYGYAGDMRDLPLETAKAIYRAIYWDRPGLGPVADRMPRLAAALFDTGVNMGPKVAATFLQRALNVLNRGARDYPDIVADGDNGPETLHALDGLAARRANAETLLLRAVECLKGARYIEIGERNPSQEVFEAGWLGNRVGDV